ncbi:glycosyltransferase [Leptolyngbya sp. GB1-A1]|uniref:glycosyltransferase family 2 protein n=1 Tax=Leptolyngbya sp. GB1-A1 TaxID=2933908 RepID=UPI003296878F
MPKVSVIVPNYNHALYLEQRIQSILNQTYQDFELIYLDDASTDHSNEVFSQFLNNSRIRAIYNETNSGSPFKQWNKGIKQANGEYIWIAESDDAADPRFLETLVTLLDTHPAAGVAYCQSRQIDSTNQLKGTMHWWTDDLSPIRWRQDFYNSGKEECQNYLLIKNTIPNASAALTRTHLFEQIGYANESMFLCGDWHTWVQLLLQTDIAFTAEELNYYRIHTQSVRAKADRSMLYLKERMQILSFLNERLELPEEAVEIVKNKLIRDWLILIFAIRKCLNFKEDTSFYQLFKTIDPLVEPRLVKQFNNLFSKKLVRHAKEWVQHSTNYITGLNNS